MSTRIEWTEETWNPVTGCDMLSPGCGLPRPGSSDAATGQSGGCYALTMAKRLRGMGQAKYQNDGDPRTSGPGFGLTLHPEALDLPFRWKKPRTVFVNSMSDLFHAHVPLDFIQRVFRVMADTPQHTYQVLTKRARRARRLADHLDWPANVWMGVSVETSGQLDRVEELRRVPAAVRFLSCEPLLGPLDGLRLDSIGWVIAGGESGPRARPMHPQWVRGVRDTCLQATPPVPFFFKQWGEHLPAAVEDDPTFTGGRAYETPGGGRAAAVIREAGGSFRGGGLRAMKPGDVTNAGVLLDVDTIAVRVGKSVAGRELDGRTWDEIPQRAGSGAGT
ncbi:phage Gp37/Gp68 family protein [Streptomyces synnematoformans]|uniref:Phage Gp37/Gp68 family protein n=1 Tax=Streptomyces synnematoformans TaxID=415721 RepID=A0ABP5J587_9ACTN